jgi:hypothetical protein
MATPERTRQDHPLERSANREHDVAEVREDVVCSWKRSLWERKARFLVGVRVVKAAD